jgi:hypothetical protein
LGRGIHEGMKILPHPSIPRGMRDLKVIF